MNNVFVYCEMEGAHVADVSLELLTKGRKLANQLGCQLETICAGSGLADVEKQVLPYGVDRVHVFDAPGLFPYTSLPHTSILVNLFKEEKPQICLNNNSRQYCRTYDFRRVHAPILASEGNNIDRDQLQG